MTYERTVAAAVAETKSKFKLAEALAEDIPPRHFGGSIEEDKTVLEHLADARQRIIDAGGESRSVRTLDEYRKTAFWVAKITSRRDVASISDLAFHWIPGISYSAHSEACRAGMSYDEFEALPSKTVDAVRSRNGIAGTDGPPEKIAESWTPEQKAAVARDLLSQPEVAEQVTDAITDHVASDPKLTADVVYKRRQSEGRRTREYDGPEPEIFRSERDYDALTEQWVNLLAVTEAAKNSGKWTPSERSEALRYFAAQILEEPSAPTGEMNDLVNEKLDDLFAEVEAYANAEVA